MCRSIYRRREFSSKNLFMEVLDNCVYTEYTVYKDIYSIFAKRLKGANAVGLWKGAWYLAKHELAKDRWKSLFTLFFIGYLLLFTVPLMRDGFIGENGPFGNWSLDFIYLSILPVLGFIANKTMMRSWKENSYTRKIAQWRTLPISSKQIALGRIIQLAIVLFAAQLVFFLLQFIIARNMGVDISALSFVLYGASWFGYSLTMGTGYVYWELGHSGKTYFFFNITYLAFLLIFSISLAFLDIGNIVSSSLHAIENGSWWLPIITVTIGVAAVFLGVKRIENRLEKRTYRA